MLHRYNHIDKWNCFIYFTFKMQIFCIRMTSQTFLRHLVMFVFFINIFSFIDLSQLFHITSMNIKCIYKKKQSSSSQAEYPIYFSQVHGSKRIGRLAYEDGVSVPLFINLYFFFFVITLGKIFIWVHQYICLFASIWFPDYITNTV